MFDNVAGVERRLDWLIAEIQAVKILLRELIDVQRELLNRQPNCTCYGHEEGTTWVCDIHGVVTRTATITY